MLLDFLLLFFLWATEHRIPLFSGDARFDKLALIGVEVGERILQQCACCIEVELFLRDGEVKRVDFAADP